MGTNVDPEAIRATNTAPLFKGASGSIFYLFARRCSLKMCSLEEGCLFPFYLLSSNLFGAILSKPGAGDLLGRYVIGRISSFVRMHSSFVGALHMACVHVSLTHVSLNVCRSWALSSNQPCIYEAPTTPPAPLTRAWSWRSRAVRLLRPKQERTRLKE